jgi:hypothetical protein
MERKPGYTRVFRAVSENEYEQILITSKFEIVREGSEGKHFADTVEGARRFGEALMGTGQFRLIEANVPDDAPSLFQWDNLDGHGPARFLHIDDLQDVRPKPDKRGDT